MKKNEVTPEKIAQWKAQYGDVYKIVVEDKECYLKAPDRKTLSYASSIGTQDPMKFNEIILTQCWLAGDEEIKTVDAYFFGAATQLDKVCEFKKAELVKL